MWRLKQSISLFKRVCFAQKALVEQLGALAAQQQQQFSQPRAACAATLAVAATWATSSWALSEPTQASMSAPEHPTDQSAPIKSNDATAQWRIFTDMGRDLVAQGRLSEAELYFKRAAGAARRGFGEEDAHVASALNNLAEYYRLRRQYDLAEPLYKQAVHILVKEYGERDARVAFARHNLGGFYLLIRSLDQAAEAYQESLKVKIEVLGPSHSETSNTLQHLAEVRWAQGGRQDAARLMQQSLDIMEGQGVGATSGCLRRRGRLAEMRLELGEVEAAEKLLRDILAYVEKAQGVDDANTATAAENLAMALSKKGDFQEARTLMQRALDARLEHVGPKHPVVAVTLRKMAELELDQATACTAGAKEGAGAGGGSTGEEAALRALDLAEQARSTAQQAFEAALAAGRAPQQGGGGVLGSWFWRSNDSLLLRRQQQHADVAALELAASWRTLSRAQEAMGREGPALESMQKALAQLSEGWPPLAGEGVGEESTAGAAEESSGESPGESGAKPGIPAAGSREAAAATAAAAMARRQNARRAKVEALRKESMCGTLRDLAGMLGVRGRADEAQQAQQRMQELGCDGR